jgi:uncharacterized RDD family membrane protein YckC
MDGAAAPHIDDPCPEAAAEQAVLTGEAADRGVNPDYWRDEVASRLERYRARRKPRAPRYPSLRLPFDPVEWLPVSGSALAVSPVVEDARAQPSERSFEIPQKVEYAAAIVAEPEFTNIIEFPRYAAVPMQHVNELAEPIFERPRIVEAPELLLPPPAMGGILMEPTLVREPDRRPAAELELLPASLPRRMAAGLLDIGVLLGALGGFGGMFVWVNPGNLPLPILAGAGIIVAPILWAAYEFLFTVYTGTTPGLQLSHLKLVRFDGSEPSRNLRRWRVLASYLSAVALGLGYLWSVLDEDGLCWHDRITRTHLT